MGCAICLKSFLYGKICALTCGCVYHVECFNLWELQRSTCPKCRIHAVRFTIRLDFTDEVQLFQEITAHANEVVRQMEDLRNNVAQLRNDNADIDGAVANPDDNPEEADVDANAEADADANAEADADANAEADADANAEANAEDNAGDNNLD